MDQKSSVGRREGDGELLAGRQQVSHSGPGLSAPAP